METLFGSCERFVERSCALHSSRRFCWLWLTAEIEVSKTWPFGLWLPTTGSRRVTNRSMSRPETSNSRLERGFQQFRCSHLTRVGTWRSPSKPRATQPKSEFIFCVVRLLHVAGVPSEPVRSHRMLVSLVLGRTRQPSVAVSGSDNARRTVGRRDRRAARGSPDRGECRRRCRLSGFC
jgi:hypothetical protein